MKLDITNLSEYLKKCGKYLVMGTPKGVGITTFFCQYIANKTFFEENHSTLILTDSNRESYNITYNLKNEYKQYNKNPLIKDGYLLTEDNKRGSLIAVINYNEINVDDISMEWDLVVIDRDWGDEDLYFIIGKILPKSNKMIVCTYDLPQSIYYLTKDDFRIILKSEISKKNKQHTRDNPSNLINGDRLIYGEFNDYQQSY